MSRKLFACAVVLAAFAGACGSRSQDAKSVVNDAARTLGAADVNSIQYSGTGFAYAFGQNSRPTDPWPKFYARYSRVVDYQKGLAKEDMVRTQFENPPRGGGSQPIYTEARSTTFVGPDSAWDAGALALTPHGWVKAAMAASPTVATTTVDGKPVTVVSFTTNGKYKVDGQLNSDKLLERVETLMPDPVLGDMPVEVTFFDYKDFGGVKFPMRIVQKYNGFPMLELNVKQVQPNVPASIQLPGAELGRTAGAPPPSNVQSHRIADGVWYLDSTTDATSSNANSVAVEFKDYAVIIESSVSEERALANIAEVKKLVPNKPIRYHVNSHHHGDHAGGMRTYIAEGVTVITNEKNKDFYEQVVLGRPRTLEPDRLSQNPKPADFIWMKDKYVLTDGNRSVEIYPVLGNGHAEYLLMSYLPKEKLLVITDVFNLFGEVRPNTPPPGIATPYYASLAENIKRLKLDVRQIAASHGHGKAVVPVSELWKQVEGTVQAPEIRPLAD